MLPAFTATFREGDSPSINDSTASMNPFLCSILRLASIAFAGCLISCSSEGVKSRQDKLTEHSVDRQERRQIRTEARQERTDAWFDRALGKPVKTSSGGTGLKMPE